MNVATLVPILTAAEMKAAEDAAIAAGVCEFELMERAGSAIAEAVWRFGSGEDVLVLCGPGNNGGDGYVAARLLAERGLDVRVAASGLPMTVVAKKARTAWTGAVEAITDAVPAPILVDALFGTGLSRPLDPVMAGQLRRLAAAAQMVIAVDVPSGVSADDGADLGAVAATVTIALGARKPAHVLQPSASLCGHTNVVDIGVQAASSASLLIKPKLAAPKPQDHKYSRGLVAVIAGAMPGAAVLAARGAQGAGAGYVVIAADQTGAASGAASLVHRSIEAAISDDRTSALVIGPGLGTGPNERALLNRLIDTEIALVIDADALSLIEEEDFRRFFRRKTPVVLTPHAGEFDALFGRGGGSKIDRAREAAKKSGCKIIFKGSDTVIASNDGRVTIAPTTSPWLSTAGTGDVLGGVVAALLARRIGPKEAAAAAVWLHAEAARLAGPAFIADDLCVQLPKAIAACL
jgi:ADP-dependent NAD(P)H-hydrate dehydratase / NAD(P)H-hydrate epimerase